jgi:hypothetical protein
VQIVRGPIGGEHLVDRAANELGKSSQSLDPVRREDNSGNGSMTIGAEQHGNSCTGTNGSPPCYAVGSIINSAAKKLLSSAGSASSPEIIPIQQTYSCPDIGSQTVQVAGQASISGRTIELTNVAFMFSDPVQERSAVISGGTIWVPDPSSADAPYISGSAAAMTAPGWTAGHDSKGVFVKFSSSSYGPMKVKTGDTIFSPPLSVKYRETGPSGTVVSWTPGNVTITLSSPIRGTFACTPTSPYQQITSVTEQ